MRTFRATFLLQDVIVATTMTMILPVAARVQEAGVQITTMIGTPMQELQLLERELVMQLDVVDTAMIVDMTLTILDLHLGDTSARSLA